MRKKIEERAVSLRTQAQFLKEEHARLQQRLNDVAQKHNSTIDQIAILEQLLSEDDDGQGEEVDQQKTVCDSCNADTDDAPVKAKRKSAGTG